MSDQLTDGRARNTPNDRIDGLIDLYPRQIRGHVYRVLSLRNDSNTAHEVDLADQSCTCKDMEHNRAGQEVCDHLAAALYQAPATISLDESAPYHVRESVERVEDAASIAEDAAAGVEDTLVRVRETDAEPAPEPDPEPVEEDPADPVTVEEVQDFIEAGFARPELVEIDEGAHDGTPGVVLRPDNQSMADHIYDSFKSLVNALDGSTAHVGFLDEACGTCGGQDGEFWYHIPADSNAEVFA
jgi:hypothetical protein